MPSDAALRIPLARWADRRIARLARETGSAEIAALTGEGLLAARAVAREFVIPGLVSPGGGCRLLRACGGWIALNLARADDRELLPALFREATLDPWDDAAIAAAASRADGAALVTQGRALGLAIARTGEAPAACASEVLARGGERRSALNRPLILDLSALWAGPLAGCLLGMVGDVVKIEHPRRPDAMRSGDPALFDRLNRGKASVTIDFTTAPGREALLGLIARADIVIEAARPRALVQAGICAEALVAARPGLVWLTITGHGARAPQADWVGFGDDTAVAGGLTGALVDAGGTIGFAGDAPADPLTGLVAALAGWRAWRSGWGQRIGLSMSGVVAMALAEERGADPAALQVELAGWSRARGAPFPGRDDGAAPAAARPLGADNAAWLAC